VAQQQRFRLGGRRQPADFVRRGVQAPGRLTGALRNCHVHDQQVGIPGEVCEFRVVAVLVGAEDDDGVSHRQPESQRRYDAVRDVHRIDAQGRPARGLQHDGSVGTGRDLDRHQPRQAAAAVQVAGQVAVSPVFGVQQAGQIGLQTRKGTAGARARDGERPGTAGEVAGFQQRREVRRVVRVKVAQADEIERLEPGAGLAEAQECAAPGVDQGQRRPLDPDQVRSRGTGVVRDGPA
jgi:hypothetical protein